MGRKRRGLLVGRPASKLVGFTIVHEVLSPELRADNTIDRLLVSLAIPFGTNEFLGERTRRI